MAIEVLLPRLGWTMEEGTLAEWLKHDGDSVQPGDILFTVESEKALNEVEASDAGVLRIPSDSPKPGSVVPVGTLLAYIVRSDEPVPFPSPESPIPNLQSRISNPCPPAISPRARRVAEESGVDWTALTGSGRTGRIVERDVRAAIQTPKAAQPAIAQSSPAQPEPAMRAPLSPTRRVIAQRMAESIHTAAPVTLTTEVDASELVKLREQLKQARGGSPAPAPSYTALFVKLCAQALHEHPAMNARLEGDELVTEAAAHIGMAVDTPRGLLVPVVRDVQDKTLLRVASEVESLAARARDGRCAPDELRGGTFTITNLGMHDVDAFTPIINLPECAVLGVGRAVLKQVVLDEDGHTAVRRMMWLSLTFDHRLVDGAPAARFLRRVKQLAEQPYLWLVT